MINKWKSTTYKVINSSTSAVLLSGAGTIDITNVSTINIEFQTQRNNSDTTSASVYGDVFIG